MGQTLTHGIYLPDEGERNCYDGLAGNWQILDNSVGTIAEHTSALSGKAPLVHTHVKADITDLFNSANTWTEHNTYTKYIYMKNSSVEIGNAPSNNTSKEIAFTDKNNATLSRVVGKSNSNGKSYIALHAINKFTNGALDPNGSSVDSYFYVGIESDGTPYNKHAADTFPDANNTYDLGSSSYQWNNLYAKNYYYNGVAWGLDKANTWSAWQTQEHTTEPLIRLKRSNLQIGDPIPASQQIIGTIPFADKNNLNLGLIACRDDTNGDTYLTLTARQRYDSNGRANNGTQYESRINLGIDSSKNLYLRPNSNGQINLGTSINKWKTLNGINPGALSLPNLDSDGYIDLSDNISANSEYLYTPVYDGWLALYCQTTGFHAENAVGIFNKEYTTPYRWNNTVTSSINLLRSGTYHGSVILPVRAGIQYGCWVVVNSSTPLKSAQLFFYKAKGNV